MLIHNEKHSKITRKFLLEKLQDELKRNKREREKSLLACSALKTMGSIALFNF